jgi:two-component sensor histidine kinase
MVMPARSAWIAALICALSFSSCSSFEPGRVAPHGPQAADGVLDLRRWDFASQGAVSLGGQWDFASGVLLDSEGVSRFGAWELREVPDFWKGGEGGDRPGSGAGTYRLRVLLPPEHPELAVRNFSGMNAFELEASGKVVARAGRPALDRASAVSAYKPGVSRVSPRLDPPSGQRSRELELLLRVSNWDYRGGGIWRCLVLGDAAALAADQQRSIYGAIALTSIMLALSVNSLMIFLNRRKEKSYFFFALFGLLIALRPLVTGEYAIARILPDLPFNVLVRIEYATAMLALPAAMAFFLSFFPVSHPKRWAAILIAPFAPFALFLFVLPLYYLTWSIFAFYAIASGEILVASIAVLARAAYRRVQGGVAMLAGGCFLALCAINDMLYSSHLIQTGNALPIALVLFIVLQSFVLAQRFTKAFDKVELLSAELKDSNQMLREEIQSAMAMSARLEESLSEKEMLLKEVHHRVKNSLQIVSSIVSLQANRSGDSAVESMSQSLKDRIRVISLANEKLYDIESGDLFDLTSYARDIVKLAVSSYESEACRLEGLVEGERIEAESAVGIDFGLVLTELVVNAFKHALLPAGGGRVLVSMRREGSELRFEVRDDGPGLPEGFDPAVSGSLGFKIVSSLLSRRAGSFSVSRPASGEGRGTSVSCTMRISSSGSASP